MAKTTKEKIAIMQAFEEGKKIECKYGGGGNWLPCASIPTWDWVNWDYRVKPKEVFPCSIELVETGKILHDVEHKDLPVGTAFRILPEEQLRKEPEVIYVNKSREASYYPAFTSAKAAQKSASYCEDGTFEYIAKKFVAAE